jgi:hypothetical protein
MAMFQRKMRDPVSGTARVIDNDGLRSIPGQSIHCPLDLMVEANGIPAYMVHLKVRPPTGKWPSIHEVLPVVLDRSEPNRVEVCWDQVSSLQDRLAAAREQRLDAAHRDVAGGSATGTPSADASPQDLLAQALADPAAFVERMRSARTQSAASSAVLGAAGSTADPVDQIAKLAELRDRGALTDVEFQALKQRILGI